MQDTQQPYSHMAKDLKLSLRHKLDQIAPEYGLLELSYPSFARCCGYIMQPISAGDAVEAISALLDVATGVRIEVEVEGARNGGEWFGGGRVWEASEQRKEDNKENLLFSGIVGHKVQRREAQEQGAEQGEEQEPEEEQPWWARNFWIAYDALRE